MAVSKTRSNYPKRIFKSTWELRGSTSSSFLSSKMSKKFQKNTRENGIAVHVCWSTKDFDRGTSYFNRAGRGENDSISF